MLPCPLLRRCGIARRVTRKAEVTLTLSELPSPLAAVEADLHEAVRHLADILAMRLRAMGWFARTVSLRLRPPAASVEDGGRAETAPAARMQPISSGVESFTVTPFAEGG